MFRYSAVLQTGYQWLTTDLLGSGVNDLRSDANLDTVKMGQSIDLSGTDDYSETVSDEVWEFIDGEKTLTAGGWFSHSALASSDHWMGGSYYGRPFVIRGEATDVLGIRVMSSTTEYKWDLDAGVTPAADGAWHRYVFLIDSKESVAADRVKCYIDGALVAGAWNGTALPEDATFTKYTSSSAWRNKLRLGATGTTDEGAAYGPGPVKAARVFATTDLLSYGQTLDSGYSSKAEEILNLDDPTDVTISDGFIYKLSEGTGTASSVAGAARPITFFAGAGGTNTTVAHMWNAGSGQDTIPATNFDRKGAIWPIGGKAYLQKSGSAIPIGTGDFGIMFWAYIANNSVERTLFTQSTADAVIAAATGFSIYVTSGDSFTVKLADGTDLASHNFDISALGQDLLGKWVHWLVNVDRDGSITIYWGEATDATISGNSSAGATGGNSDATITSGSGNFTIGASAVGELLPALGCKIGNVIMELNLINTTSADAIHKSQTGIYA